MSKMIEYKVGEIFRYHGETYKCLDGKIGDCGNCEFKRKIQCSYCTCSELERSDGRAVYFIRVTEPEEGMLFRASDGVLYELKKLEYRGRGCYLYGYMSCSEIDEEAFGEMIPAEDLHWYPVEEEKGETMEKKRHLELAVVKVEGDQVTFRIAEQTHRGIDFSKNAPYHHFCGSNGMVLFSFDQPCFDPERGDIYVRGRCCSCDDEQMTVSVDKFAKIMETINEYNETDGKGYEKPWPQDGDKYFCINSHGCANEYTYGSNDYMDEARCEFGNFFRTREEAEAARERVKKALKGPEND